MSFLRDFGGGFARQLTENLIDERDRMNKLADDETMLATRQRLNKEAEREAEKKIAEETSGLLMSLGYDESAVESILSKGKLSANFWATAGQDALKKGVNPNTLYNMPNMDESNFTETVDSVEDVMAVPTGLGEIEEDATLKSAEALETSGEDSVTISSGFSINKDAFKNLYGTPDKEEASFGARLAVLSQRIARKPNDPNMESWKAEQQSLLADLATMKAAEREEKDGAQTPAFGLGTISANVKEIRSGVAGRFGFTVGIDGQIDNMEDGTQHLADIVELNIAGQLTTRNKDIQDKSMENTAEGIRNSAISHLTDYGYNIYNNDKDKLKIATEGVDNSGKKTTAETEFANNIVAGNYKPGEVIVVGNRLIIYTGIKDYVTGQPFIELNQKNVDF